MAAGEVTLEQLDGPALAAWLKSSGATDVEEQMAAGETRAEAESHAGATFERLFPGGSPAPGQLVGRVRYVDREVGWLRVGPAGGDPRRWWVWVVEIDSDVRGQGHGRRAMLLAEQLARAHAAPAIGLNVFGSNKGRPRALYLLGYKEASIQKRLENRLDEGTAMTDDGGVSLPRRAITVTLGTAAGLAAALAGIYLVVACESLPSVLGPVAGDTQPRTKLGAVTLLLAVILAVGAVLAARTRDDRR